MANEIYDKNYLWRDYVTEDIAVLCFGQIDLYFFKETLVGVRDNKDMVAFFITLESVPKSSSPYAPTMEKLTEEHIKEAIDELDTSGEKLERIHMDDLMSKSMELCSMEVSRLLDKHLLQEA
jgi:hypothetical protein